MHLTTSLHETLLIPLGQVDQVAGLFRLRELKMGEVWLQQAEGPALLGWVVSGYCRIHADVVLGQEVKEVTQWIATPHYFVVDAAAFFGQQAPRWTVTALTEVVLYELDQQGYQSLQQMVPDWPRYESQFLIRCFQTIENRVFDLLALPAYERFVRFMSIFGFLVNEVPHKYLASMLGMTPETFSRVRRQFAMQ